MSSFYFVPSISGFHYCDLNQNFKKRTSSLILKESISCPWIRNRKAYRFSQLATDFFDFSHSLNCLSVPSFKN